MFRENLKSIRNNEGKGSKINIQLHFVLFGNCITANYVLYN